MADFTKIFSTRQGKVILIISSILIAGYILFAVGTSIYSINNEVNKTLKLLLLSPKDFFQILFFIVVATVGVLSYIRAKETLFTPIKTETFKMQIKSFEEVLLFFQNKGEIELSNVFDFDKILHINAHFMMNDYVSTFFKDEIEINEEAIKEQTKDLEGAIVTQSFMEKHFMSPEYHEKPKKEEESEITNPALVLNKWREYEYGKIEYTKKYMTQLKSLEGIKASPLIPNDLKEKIEEFEKNVHHNLSLVGKVLTEISQELPERFPNAESVKNFNSFGIWNKYNKEKKDLESAAREIMTYIKEYLKIEELIK